MKDYINTKLKNNTLENQISQLKSQNKTILQQNFDLQKKLDILEESLDYYKKALNDSQKAIQEVSEYSKNLRFKNTELINKLSKQKAKK